MEGRIENEEIVFDCVCVRCLDEDGDEENLGVNKRELPEVDWDERRTEKGSFVFPFTTCCLLSIVSFVSCCDCTAVAKLSGFVSSSCTAASGFAIGASTGLRTASNVCSCCVCSCLLASEKEEEERIVSRIVDFLTESGESTEVSCEKEGSVEETFASGDWMTVDVSLDCGVRLGERISKKAESSACFTDSAKVGLLISAGVPSALSAWKDRLRVPTDTVSSLSARVKEDEEEDDDDDDEGNCKERDGSFLISLKPSMSASVLCEVSPSEDEIDESLIGVCG